MKKAYSSSLVLILLIAKVVIGQPSQNFPSTNARLAVEERTKDLLRRMTLEEKIGQLQCWIGDLGANDSVVTGGLGGLAISLRSLSAKEAAERANHLQRLAVEKTRLGIPLIIHDEALHGLVGKGATSFPQAIALAATWDPDLMERVAAVIGRQTKSRGIRQVLSPVVNVVRDARWGRVEETYGEDPYLTARMGVAFCKPIEAQGVITTPKHIVANVGDGGRDSHAIEVSETQLREVYFPPFQACFQEAHALSVMAAYNSVNELPSSANPWLLTDVLRNEWGFQGFVVSDYGSVSGIVSMHHTASDKTKGVQQALVAGLDIELPQVDLYGQPLLQAVREGMIPGSVLDTAVSRVLRAKFLVELFDNPYTDPNDAAKLEDTAEDRALALEAARKSIVLLKNENGVLPLKKDLKSIAIIGPNAEVVRLGGYSGFGMKVASLLDGIKQHVSLTTKAVFAKGSDLSYIPFPAIAAEYLIPSDAKSGERGLRGEYFNNMDLTGKPLLVRLDQQIDFDWGVGSPDSTMPVDHFSIRWRGKLVPPVSRTFRLSITTDDGVRVWVDGKLVDDSWFDRSPTSDFFSLKLEAGRQYDLRIELYENAGGAFASLGWDLKAETDKELQQAVDAARGADVAVIAVGIVEGEGRDRANLDLPGGQEDLIKAVVATGVPTVIVLINGSPITMQNWIENVPAIVEAWYAGEDGGNAIADVLFGDVNPGGKLPITFPQFVGQCPIYYNMKPSGRGYDYVDMKGKPLFPFGYGLSYTRFEYTNLRIHSKTVSPTGKVEIKVDVRNVGQRSGDEVVQLYLHDVVASVVRPLMELKGFRRISLAAGEMRTVLFTLTAKDLEFLDAKMQSVVEPGEFEVMLGSSSQDIRARGSFEVVK